MRATFTPEQIAWLAQAYRVSRIPELTRRYNRRWGTDWRESQIKQACNRNRLHCGRPPGFAKGEGPRLWSDAEIAWLRERRPIHTVAELAEAFSARFGRAVTASAINGTCKRYGIAAGGTGQFTAGSEPWNKGLKGVTFGGVETQFQPGNHPHTEHPVGAYRTSKEGYWLLKVSEDQEFSRHNWVAVHHLTWLAAHGPIPRGHVVVFLDNNPDNCLDADNLACIPRGVLARLNQMGWSALQDPESRRAAIALAQVVTAAHRLASDTDMSRAQKRIVIGTGRGSLGAPCS